MQTADNTIKTRLPVWLLLLAAVLAPAVASAQSFGAQTIANRTYVVGHALIPLTLPTATSGNPSYTLPNLPAGLSFNAATRVLSGTPSTPTAVAAYTYTATGGASLTFRLAVIPANAGTDGFIVSNLDEEREMSPGNNNNLPILMAFVTGANAGGYIVTGAAIRLDANSVNNLSSVSVRSTDTSVLGTLDGPAGALPAGGDLTYTSADGIRLAPSATYYLAADGQLYIRGTTSINQTSLDGWDIVNGFSLFNVNRIITFFPEIAPRFNISAFPADVPPGVPASLAASPFSGGVTLTWTTPTAIATTYQYRQRPSGGTWDNWMGADTPLVVSGLTGCTTFQVRALNGTISGPASETSAAPLGMSCSIKLRLRVFLEGPLR